jgi:hypothetical protein
MKVRLRVDVVHLSRKNGRETTCDAHGAVLGESGVGRFGYACADRPSRSTYDEGCIETNALTSAFWIPHPRKQEFRRGSSQRVCGLSDGRQRRRYGFGPRHIVERRDGKRMRDLNAELMNGTQGAQP